MPTKVIVGKDCVRENSDVFKIGEVVGGDCKIAAEW